VRRNVSHVAFGSPSAEHAGKTHRRNTLFGEMGFLAERRQHPTWCAIPTLVFTGVSIAERRRDELGSLPVFTKPVNFDHLLTVLRRAMIHGIDPDVVDR